MNSKDGFTLSEVLIVVAIIALLAIVGLSNMRQQVDRGYDAKRKNDLHDIRNAFEGYYDDHQCYPPITILDQCNGLALQPYIDKVPCDPVKKTPYVYRPRNLSNLCKGYAVLTTLTDKKDPDITAVGCTATDCGYGDGTNWGVAVGGSVYP